MPPSIIDKETSTDMVVREANNATLTCKAAGYPEPYVMWRREDGDDINYNGDTGTVPYYIYYNISCNERRHSDIILYEYDNEGITSL